jgi:dihydrofolate synthase/folylpolyglutamate synthase
LGLDHTEILGNTVEEIAAQKAGIINPNSHAIVLDPGVSPKLVIEQIAKEKSADLDIVSANSYNYLGAESGGITFSIPGLGFEQNFHLPLYGEYQAQNATLAIRALQFLAGKDNFAIDNRIIQNGLNNVRIPARTEIRKVLNRQIIIDAAHNPQKIASFIDMLKEANTPNNAVIIFGTKKGKNFIDELKELNKYFKKIIITGFFNDEPSTIFKSEDPMLVARQADALGLKVLNVSKYPFDAFNYAIAETNENQPIIVTGSIYMIGELNSKL